MGVMVSTARSNKYPKPELMINPSVALLSFSLIIPWSPYKSPDVQTTLIEEHSVLNINFLGARISILEEDEYKLQTASIGFWSISTVLRSIYTENSFGLKVAQDAKNRNEIKIRKYFIVSKLSL